MSYTVVCSGCRAIEDVQDVYEFMTRRTDLMCTTWVCAACYVSYLHDMPELVES